MFFATMEERNNYIIKVFLEGVAIKDISKVVNIAPNTIYQLLERKNIKRESDKIELRNTIYQEYLDGTPISELSVKYGKAIKTIKNIVHGRKIKEVCNENLYDFLDEFKSKDEKPFNYINFKTLIMKTLELAKKERDVSFLQEFQGELAEMYCLMVDKDYDLFKEEMGVI